MSTVEINDDAKSKKAFNFVVNYTQYPSTDRTIDDREILEKSGHRPASEHILIRIFERRTLAVDSETKFDLKDDDVGSFRAFKGDRIFRFSVEDRVFEWGAAAIDETELRQICVLRDDQVFKLERSESADEIVDDETNIDFQGDGTEHLRIVARPQATITVNKNKVTMRRGWTTGRGIKSAAIAQGVNIREDFVLDQELPNGDTQLIGDNDPVFVKGGERFGAVDHHEDS
ncbi:hypothetical protein [Rhizobium johnstonii]|uniref:hypothetical protein n=1 Tax=Rhizobium johnstonii TaxID=3019933 RepID=UPI002DDD6A3A|nr:hypothetical protein U8P72_11965 [Rhizobium johnstonii]